MGISRVLTFQRVHLVRLVRCIWLCCYNASKSIQDVRRCMTSVASNWEPAPKMGWDMFDQVGLAEGDVWHQLSR